MSSYPGGRVYSPPDLPPYLQNVYDLKPIIGVPSDDQVIEIHAVMHMAQKAVDIPGTGDRVLLARLAEHLFNVQMDTGANISALHFRRRDTTYTPPTLPPHVTVQLEPVIDAPSEEEIIKVQNAIRSYNQIANTKYTQRARQNQGVPVPCDTPLLSSTATPERASDPAQGPATNNPGTGPDTIIDSNQPTQVVSDAGIRDCLQQSNRLAEQANQLVERSNLLIERSNQIADRANELAERSTQPTEQPSTFVEEFIELIERTF
ncbi:unnamed protein product [Rhizoctonia solani]|uniref:Laminin domain protein n=1 Tax=Rhizoctonia solani TaxID=456999 RepID=A0A8H2X9K4_9AGAM|nr:unnamed protein product [Rhizoctonia solani]